MMIYLGTEQGDPFYFDSDLLRTHLHVIGGTGKGKTTALESMMHQLFCEFREPGCHFIFDRLGGLSASLLMWVSSPYCPKWVRKRFIYFDAADEQHVMPFHPLTYTTLGHGYFKVMRAVECILRGFENQNISEMPRLWRWIFNSFWAMALMKLSIADAAHLLFPGSGYHEAILLQLPSLLQAEWAEILGAKGSEATRILESARNRLKPYIECPLTKNFFGSTTNRFDVARFMSEGRIVLIDLSPKERIAPEIADAMGGLMLNEILATARSRRPEQRTATYAWLDEFQRFVGPDMTEAIPEVRQLNVRLILSHQSMSQLVRGDTDLTSIIWQCQSRMILGMQGDDADILAHEIATWRYDPKRVKEEQWTLRQITDRQDIIRLCSWSDAHQEATNWSDTVGENWSAANGTSTMTGENKSESDTRLSDGKHAASSTAVVKTQSKTVSATKAKGGSAQHGHGGSTSDTKTTGEHEVVFPVLKTFKELSSRQYYSFDEQKVLEAQSIRMKKTGDALLMLANADRILDVKIERDAPGYLEYDIPSLHRLYPAAFKSLAEFLRENFSSEFFVSPADIQAEMHDRLESILHPAGEQRLIGHDRGATDDPAGGKRKPEKNSKML